MRASTVRFLSAALACGLSGCARPAVPMVAPAPSPTYVFEDAERLAAVLARNALPDSATLQRAYLDPGTAGVRIFTPYRIESAGHLATAIARHPAKYRHAADVCLPVARTMAPEAELVLRRVASLFGVSDSVAPVYIVFGADNSGGHAEAAGLVIGLEVACDGLSEPEAVRQALRNLFAHEVTHTYQARAWTAEPPENLLMATLTEGVPDFVRSLVLDAGTLPPDARAVYGAAHERELWREFKADLDAGAFQKTDWMYGPGRGGRPADLGYWIGQRIAEAYFARASDKPAALRALLELKDPQAILKASGYGEGW